MIESLPHGWALATTLVAVAVELPTRKIPNWLTLAGLLGGMVATRTLSDFVSVLVGLLIVGLVSLTLFAWGWFPGGTSKLLIALGGTLGWKDGLALTTLVFLVIALWYFGERVRPRRLREADLQEHSMAAIHRSIWLTTSPMILIGLLLLPYARGLWS